MSRQIALDNIQLRAAPRWGRTEYSLEYHHELARELTGHDVSEPGAIRALFDALGFDFVWSTDDGLCGAWLARGRATDMGHAEYAEGGTDRHAAARCPFASVQEVWDFDPDAEYGLPPFEEQVSAYERLVRQARLDYPDQLVTGGYYKTMVSGAIQAFGWEMLLEAAADLRRFEGVLDRFYRRTLFHMRAWASTTAEVVIQHDDFVWTSGPFMSPDFYRGAIIPRFAELWKPLHGAGKKVLFCSDGTFLDLAEDVVRAGADGLIFEPSNDFSAMVERFGSSTCLVGSAVDCRDLTLGHMEAVRRDVAGTFSELRRCRGAVVAVGNHLPANIEAANLRQYLSAVQELNRREAPHRG